jgi:signal transduction histidine kinase
LSMFGQHAESDPGPADVNRAISDALEVVSGQMRLENIAVALDLADGLPTVVAHEHRLGQVMLNLLTNAMEAIVKKAPADSEGEAGTVTIRSRIDGDWVVFAVEDTGVGIPEHHLERVMEPFFTTKEASAGKGLGLSVCRQIIRGYGGTIRFRSRGTGGATVEVRLPRPGS